MLTIPTFVMLFMAQVGTLSLMPYKFCMVRLFMALIKAQALWGNLHGQAQAGKALTDADFVNAAKAAGIDPTSILFKANSWYG
jgi:ABC-type dipeptide/oligopeptide/nickel transport system permease subunit